MNGLAQSVRNATLCRSVTGPTLTGPGFSETRRLLASPNPERRSLRGRHLAGHNSGLQALKPPSKPLAGGQGARLSLSDSGQTATIPDTGVSRAEGSRRGPRAPASAPEQGPGNRDGEADGTRAGRVWRARLARRGRCRCVGPEWARNALPRPSRSDARQRRERPARAGTAAKLRKARQRGHSARRWPRGGARIGQQERTKQQSKRGRSKRRATRTGATGAGHPPPAKSRRT